jgi:hypothetical protein
MSADEVHATLIRMDQTCVALDTTGWLDSKVEPGGEPHVMTPEMTKTYDEHHAAVDYHRETVDRWRRGE